MIKNILIEPMTTEKSAKSGVQTFLVHRAANKPLIRAAIKAQYGVTPRRVNIINQRGKKVLLRGTVGNRSDWKKALVYLKPGDKIDLAKREKEVAKK